MATITLTASPRAILGKRSRYLRRAGITPANLYGAGIDSTALQVDTRHLINTIVQTTKNTPVSLQIEGEAEARTVFLWRVQRDPLTEDVLHVDLFHVEATRTMRATVPIYLDNVDPDLEKFSKRVNQLLNEVEVETLPMDLPEEIRLDGAQLQELDDEIKVEAIDLGDKVTVLTDPDLIIAKVFEYIERVEEEEEEVLEGEEGEEGEGEEGEEGAAEGGDEAPAEGD